ncbi:pumilio domain-containing protein [Verticillium dahliae VdLs.17]|uniref:Pumilio domain-containing protein n=1 Tax=Verticillium dahliae (strain VdLs.17 / ATCC MYA-4575 / FGSC 10137) TaxID=498257 RepID=G2X6Q8_VERDV|nr:pumilio domain-containing protein [Verticillium dahliae VdLs.17]EGY14676.1 pumilio domain-containing protein [Verticillium dahliae VdLs.17]
MPGSSRLYSKRFVGPPSLLAVKHAKDLPSHRANLEKHRAREIQAQEGIPGLPLNPWGGPPTSGNSTPLRENIPESPTDGFPDFAPPMPASELPQARRARAGTLPSRFSPGGPNLPPGLSRSNRVTPSHTPLKSPSPALDGNEQSSSSSALLSRLRAGSMPQRSPFAHVPGTSSPFGPSIFSSWNPAGVGRERGSTLASIASIGSNGPSSPAQSHFSKEGAGENDVHMRTLDYLGLAETPQPPRAQLATPYLPANYNDLSKASRFRSYSVNNKDKYADEEDDYDEMDGMYLESQYAAQLQDQLAATNAAIHSHNMAVQAFVNQASRPRARTAGVLDTPGSRLMRTYLPSNGGGPPSLSSAELRHPDDKDYDELPQAVAAMNLGRSNSRNAGLLNAEDQGLEGPTSALWLGSIPTSTTTSTLTEMFKSYGPILSARVLTHKNCGFVNFERVESAITAKASMNGKEIFPGAGPIRINFAKPPSASNTPGHDGVFPSPSPDPFAKGQENGQGGAGSASNPADGSTVPARSANTPPNAPSLQESTADILQIVKQFQASEEDLYRISGNLQSAVQFDAFVEEIPPIREPAHSRVHDAPKLRDIRKRIDNQSLSKSEIENIAVDMLPEIAELSSDYLGNTVVQKLFEHCSDELRDAMLAEIAPHMAEIGVHKNGTWAAQKIIDVCKTPQQMMLIVEHLRPYTIGLFLDQYGNYVLQGCLKFGAPYNDFIFETMVGRLWDVAQGRYGARAMRACLESHHSTKDQQRMLAAVIALHSVQLATNANGALLLTWFLDTCTFPQRRTVLSPQLVPYLVHLCTHKVAYLTVLKVINQKAEPEARDTILKALFFTPKDHVLEAILSDHACGATLIFKVLTTPFFDETIRSQVVENVKNVLIRIKAQPGQGYKRLMDEVGLSTRNASGGASRDHSNEQRQRPSSRQANINGHQQAAPGNKQFYNQMNPTSTPNYDAGGFNGQRNDAADANMTPFPSYGVQNPAMFNPANQMPPTPANLQQMQYQQSMLQRGTPPNFFPPMQAGFSPSPSMDHYRNQNMPNGSPIQPVAAQVPPGMGPAPGYGAPGYGMNMGMPGGYGYNGNMGGMQNLNGMQNMGYMQQEQVNGRRGRPRASSRTPYAPLPNDDHWMRSRRPVSSMQKNFWEMEKTRHIGVAGIF